MRKRWYFPKKKKNFFSNRRWTNQTFWRRSRRDLIREHPIQGDSHVDFFPESEEGFFHRFTTLFRKLVKRFMIFGGQEVLSPRHAMNRRRRTREGPQRACVQTLLWWWHTQERKDELTSCRGTFQSAWQQPPVKRKGGSTGLHQKV